MEEKDANSPSRNSKRAREDKEQDMLYQRDQLDSPKEKKGKTKRFRKPTKRSIADQFNDERGFDEGSSLEETQEYFGEAYIDEVCTPEEEIYLSPKRTITMRILQREGLYKKRPALIDSPRGSQVLSHISPSKYSLFVEEGGSPEDLKRMILELQRSYPPVLNCGRFPDNPDNQEDGSFRFFSPVARKCYSRVEMLFLIEKGWVQSLPAPAFVPPYVEETPEERLARKAKQKADFEAAERLNGHTPEDLELEMQGAIRKLTLYFNYIEHRKSQWEQGVGAQLRWYDKVDAFDQFVAHQEGLLYTFVMGYQLYAFKDTLDLKRENEEGYTNKELMEQGYCPIGADGKVMNYHHLTRIDALTHKPSGNKDESDRRFIMLLLPSSIHTGYSGVLHLSGSFYRDLPNKTRGQGIDRTAFGNARKAFSQALVKLLDQ